MQRIQNKIIKIKDLRRETIEMNNLTPHAHHKKTRKDKHISLTHNHTLILVFRFSKLPLVTFRILTEGNTNYHKMNQENYKLTKKNTNKHQAVSQLTLKHTRDASCNIFTKFMSVTCISDIHTSNYPSITASL